MSLNYSTDGFFETWRGRVSLIAGPIISIAIFFLVPVQDTTLRAQLSIVFFTLIWWVGEPVPLGITALLVPILETITGIARPRESFSSFAHPLIFLFLGSFFIAEAIIEHGLDRWIARKIISIRWVQKSPLRIVLALGFITWFLSMWISNTAATAMMIPLGYGLMKTMSKSEKRSSFATGTALFIAYSASVGGISTPIGTPPNVVTLGFLEELAGIKITFFQWFIMVLPLSLGILIVIYSIMRILFLSTTGADQLVNHGHDFHQNESLAPNQKAVLVVFIFVVFMWLLPGIISIVYGKKSPEYAWVHNHLNESTTAMLGACFLFLIPSRAGEGRILDWRIASRIDWNTIFLFGGGLTLGEMTLKTGLGRLLGMGMLSYVKHAGIHGVTAVSQVVSVTMTEFMSNTATSNLVIPFIISVMKTANVSIIVPVVAACISTSMAFLLPVSTPPNAIAYGTGYIRIKDMIRAGILCDIAALLVVFCYVTGLHFMGII